MMMIQEGDHANPTPAICEQTFRYGGWREGLESNSSVVANSENTAVYFNNKVCVFVFLRITMVLLPILNTLQFTLTTRFVGFLMIVGRNSK